MLRLLVVFALVDAANALLSVPPMASHLLRSQRLGIKLADATTTSVPEPMFTEETMPKVSPTLQCVMSLSLQFFILYTCLALVRTANQFDSFHYLGPQKILENASTTVTYAPMLCVLFLGARMRAIQLTQGETEKYKLPQPWVQIAMFSTVYAVLAQIILVLLIPCFTGEVGEHVDEHGDIDTSMIQVGGQATIVLSALRYIIMLALYGGFAVVIVGICIMEGPKEIWGDKSPPVSPAVVNTIVLTVTFFTVYFFVALTKTAIEIIGRTEFLAKLEGIFTLARYTVNFAPMLSILFIGARIRALQMDPKYGNPQRWAQMCFYGCTASVVAQTFLVIFMPFYFECQCEAGSCEGDVIFIMADESVTLATTTIRYLLILLLYGGFTAVIASVFLISHPKDPSLTPPISPAMHCVMTLTVQYFAVYLVLFVSISAKELTKFEVLDTVIAIFDRAQKTVMLAPMLSILFIACRMRALQLTKAKDGTLPISAGPQAWVQDGMFLATWSATIQLILAILVPICTGFAKPEVDDSGNVKVPKGTSMMFALFVEAVGYVCLVTMYGGIITVMIGIYMMTPETLPPYADLSKDGPLLPDVSEVPKPAPWVPPQWVESA